MTGLMIHVEGSLKATEEDVINLPVAEQTESYCPLPNGQFLNMVYESLKESGLTVIRKEFGIAKQGAQMFGVLRLAPLDERDNDSSLAIGLRNSSDKSLRAGFCAGSNVFVCDNLCFSGEVVAVRKHTIRIMEELPEIMRSAVGRLRVFRDKQCDMFDVLKSAQLSDVEAESFILRTAASRKPILPVHDIIPVYREYMGTDGKHRHEEFAPRTAWSLFNAFTEVAKHRKSITGEYNKRMNLFEAFRSQFCPEIRMPKRVNVIDETPVAPALPAPEVNN